MIIEGSGATTASRLYVHELERAYVRGREVYDPDYALTIDPDVYSIIRRDPDTAHAIQQRKHLVAGSRWRVVPASDDDVDRNAAGIVEKIIGKMKRFAMSRLHLADAVFKGQAWAIVEGRQMRLRVNGKVSSWWVPTAMKAVDKRRFRQFTADDGSVGWEFYSIERHAYEPLPAERRRWFVRVAYDDSEDSLGYGRGLLEAIYHPQYAKAKVTADLLDGVEKWSHGTMVAKVDGLRVGASAASNTANTTAWLELFKVFRSRHGIVCDKEDEVDLIESSGAGHEMATSTLAMLTTSIRTLILGANLPTQATSGGSYALAEVQENSTEVLVRFDRELMGEALSDDLVPLVMMMNRAQLAAEGCADAEHPSVAIVGPIVRDGNSANALAALTNAGWQGIREDEAFDAVGLTPAGPHDKQLEVRAPAGAGVAEKPKDEPDSDGLSVAAQAQAASFTALWKSAGPEVRAVMRRMAMQGD